MVSLLLSVSPNRSWKLRSIRTTPAEASVIHTKSCPRVTGSGRDGQRQNVDNEAMNIESRSRAVGDG